MDYVKWCANCNVPIVGSECEICGAQGRKCARDLKPIFGHERALLERLLGVRLPSFAFIHRNRIVYRGRTYLTFKLDTANGELRPLYRWDLENCVDEMDFEEGMKLAVKANLKYLEEKEKEAINFIKSTFHDCSQAFVLFGGGKDSAVVASLAKKALSNVALLFIDTTLEFPETYQFVEDFSKLYNLPLIKDFRGKYYRAEHDFFQLCERLGPPSIYHRWCCHIFKEQPVRRFINDYLKDEDSTNIMFLTGIRRKESKRRSDYTFIELGKRVARQVLVQPINDWSNLEVWLYTFWRGIKSNTLYELGHARVGCWPCPCTPPLMDFIRRLTHAQLWKRFEKVLFDYANKNNRPERWVKEGLWRLRKPKRQKILIDPIHVEEKDDEILFKYVIPTPHRINLVELLKVLGDRRADGKEPFSPKTKHDLRLSYRVQGAKTEIVVSCTKSSYVVAKGFVEEVLFRLLNCIGCGACSSRCPKGALQVIEGGIAIDPRKCNKCMSCLKSPCIVRDSEKMYVARLDVFSLAPCEKGLPLKHVTFLSEEIGRKVAKKLEMKGVNVEIHDGGKVICVNEEVSVEEIEQLALS